jgi:uncharacterized protein (TIGR03083 family)
LLAAVDTGPVDYIAHFTREAAAFEAAARAAASADAAPAVPSCPGWTVTDLVLHLGTVHRTLVHVIAGRLTGPPSPGDRSWLALPGEYAAWLPPGRAPGQAAFPPELADWFAVGAAHLRDQFVASGPDEAVWTWWPADRTVGFWRRMQAIEAAVHRWDAQAAAGAAGPVDPELAADAVTQTFGVMVPARRARAQAPAGRGERFGFRSTDMSEYWAIRFDGAGMFPHDGPCDVELSGTASDLMLFLWHRVPADARADAGAGRFTVHGDASVLDRYFALVPPT